MAPNPLNSSNLEQLALKGLTAACDRSATPHSRDVRLQARTCGRKVSSALSRTSKTGEQRRPTHLLPIAARIVVVAFARHEFHRAISGNSVSVGASVIFVNENENEKGEKRENNEFVNEN